MSELKAIELENNLGPDINGVEHRVPWLAYDKDEVDKVIAEKDEQLSHHKYHRCLDKAWLCEVNVYNIRRKPLCDMDDHEGWQHDNELWQRWYNRWLELADKFKEAK